MLNESDEDVVYGWDWLNVTFLLLFVSPPPLSKYFDKFKGNIGISSKFIEKCKKFSLAIIEAYNEETA